MSEIGIEKQVKQRAVNDHNNHVSFIVLHSLVRQVLRFQGKNILKKIKQNISRFQISG